MAAKKRSMADNPAMQFLSSIGTHAEPESPPEELRPVQETSEPESQPEPKQEPQQELSAETPVETHVEAPVEAPATEKPVKEAIEQPAEPERSEPEPVKKPAEKKVRKKNGTKQGRGEKAPEPAAGETEALTAYMREYRVIASREKKSVRTTISLYPSIYNTAMQLVDEGKIKSLNDVINTQLAALFNIEIPR